MTSFVKLEQTNYDDKKKKRTKAGKRQIIKKYTNWYYLSYFFMRN